MEARAAKADELAGAHPGDSAQGEPRDDLGHLVDSRLEQEAELFDFGWYVFRET